MKLLLPTFFIFALSTISFGQKTVADLKPAHAVALEQFLSKNKDYGFLSENVIEAEDLKFMRKYLGKTLKPFYNTADYNGDGVIDFALIISKKGTPKKAEDGDYFIHSLAVVIFNGVKKGGFKQAFIENVEVPLNCFIKLTNEKKKKLYFGVNETDADTMIFTPVGKGYIIEYPDEP
jgi:hypothetical protein